MTDKNTFKLLELIKPEVDFDLSDVMFVATSNSMNCLLYTSPSPRDRTRSRMPSSA